MAGYSGKSRKNAGNGEVQAGSPPAARPKGRGLLLLTLVISFGLLVAGLITPALHVTSFAFLHDEVTILGSIEALRGDGQFFLAALIFVVSIAFPVVKISLALVLALSFSPDSRWSHWIANALSELARWSMTDVFILAVVVMVIDARLINSANLMPGAYYFAAGIILSSTAVHILRGSLKRHARANAIGT